MVRLAIGFIGNLLAYVIPAGAAKWVARGIAVAIGVGLLWLAINAAIGAIRADARSDLLAEQASERANVTELQRARERQAEQGRRDELKSGAVSDAALQKEIADATKDLPDERPSARTRSRICVELRQQARRRSEPAPDC